MYAFAGYSRARGTADLTDNGKVEGYWESTIKTALLNVNVIDTGTWTITQTIAPGSGPDGLALR